MIKLPEPGQDERGYKVCCASLYASDAVRFLLGDSMRPGGLDLTRQLLGAAGLRPGAAVLDVACGVADSRAAVEEQGGLYHGVDLGVKNLTAVAGKARLAAADADWLPFADGSFDAVMLQCAFCTFPDKGSAARELVRVLKPGGCLLLADVVLDCATLPSELDSVFAAAACLADALPMRSYAALVEEAGMLVQTTQDQPDAALHFLRSIDQKLLMVRVAQAVGRLDLGDVDIEEVRRLLKLGMAMVERGELSFGYLIATKPPVSKNQDSAYSTVTGRS